MTRREWVRGRELSGAGRDIASSDSAACEAEVAQRHPHQSQAHSGRAQIALLLRALLLVHSVLRSTRGADRQTQPACDRCRVVSCLPHPLVSRRAAVFRPLHTATHTRNPPIRSVHSLRAHRTDTHCSSADDETRRDEASQARGGNNRQSDRRINSTQYVSQ